MTQNNVKEDTHSPRPLLVFVLGAPCSGKSTLSTALAKRYNLTHFSLGDDLRSLVSSTPSGPAAHIKPLFTHDELEIFRENLCAGTLGPVHLTPRYVKERVFSADCDPQHVRMLIDGFPRDAARWASFKEVAKPIWEPSGKSVVVLLEVDREVAFERFVGRGRPGDVFERRFEEHSRLGPAVVEEMGRDGVMVFKVEKGCDVQEAVEKLAQFWAEDASNYTP